MVTTHRPETQEQALIRLAAKARTEGVKLRQDPAGGRYYASSVSRPGHLHYVTGYSCDCAGFVQHGRCKHYAALLSALGWITRPNGPHPLDASGIAYEPEPSPAAVPPARCRECSGLGEVPTGHGGMWGPVSGPCQTCQGTGETLSQAA